MSEDTDRDGERRAEERRAEERRRRYFEVQVGIPPVHLRLLRDAPEKVDETRPALREAADWLGTMDARPWLLLCGPPGLGKSFAASWLAIRLSPADPEDRDPFKPRPRGARIVRALEIDALAPWDDELVALSEMNRVLMLDDVGVGFQTQGETTRMKLEIVATPRYDNLRPLVLTTNLRYTAFEQAHPRVADRFHEIGRVVELDGRSLRRAP